MNRSIKIFGICVICVLCGLSMLYADIIQLKNGSTMEGKIVKQTEDEVELETSLGTIGIKTKDIEEIIKADYVPEIKWIEEVPVETLPIIETQPITPSTTVTSTATTEEKPFSIGLEAKTPVQEEINALLAKLANLEEGEEPWTIVQQITTKGMEDIPYLITLLDDIKEPDILARLVFALGNSKDNAVVRPLIDKLKAADEKVRTAVVNALAKFPHDQIVVSVLRASLPEEKSDKVRIALINALAESEDTRSVSIFINLLSSENKAIRYAVSNAIVKLHQLVMAESEGEPEVDVVALLLDRLRRADLQMKKEILTLIGQLKDPRALEALVDLLGDRDAGIRALVAMALGGLKDKKANEYIVERLYEERDTWTKLQLVLALQKSRDFSVVPALIDMLEDSDVNVRFGAGRALRAITKRGYSEDYDRWSKWWNAFRGK